MYDVKIALNTLLALVYISKILKEDVDEALVKSTLEAIKTPEHINEDDESSAISYIKGLIEQQQHKKEFDKADVLRRVKVATSLFPDYSKNLEIFLSIDEGKPQELRKELSSHKAQLRNFVNKSQLRANVGKLYGALSRNDTSTVNEELDKLKLNIEKEREGKTQGSIPGLVSSISTKDSSGFAAAIKKSQEILTGAVFKTGFRGINRMLGAQGGIRMTELALMPALPFNGKTLFSQSIFLSVGVVNSAEDFREYIPGDKEPMFLDMSFENTQDINIPQAFEMVYGNCESKNGEAEVEIWRNEKRIELLAGRDPKSLSLKEARGIEDDIIDYTSKRCADYLASKLSEKGWTYQFDQIINTEFSITYLQDMISMYEAQGYHIMGVRGDYLGTIKKDGLGSGVAGTDIKEAYRIARNYTAMRDKFALLPHQLSPDAKRFKAIDPSGFVRNLPGRGFYEGCTSLDNEADLEFYFGVTDQEDKRYLEVQRGKHRAGTKTQSKDMYCVIPFCKDRILPWDMLLDEELSKKSLSDFSSGGGMGMGDWGI